MKNLLLTSTGSIRPLALACAALALAGCSVGPDYKHPKMRLPNALTETAPNSAAQTFVQQDIPANWWEVFHSPALNALIQQALKNNPSVDLAKANLAQAIDNVKAQQATFFPTISANYNLTRQRVASPLASPLVSNSYIYNQHTAQLNAAYTLDVWGGNRRQVEALKAQEAANRYTIESTYLTLTSNVVNAAIQEALLREQIEINQSVIQRQQELMSITREGKKLGQNSDNDIATQEAALATAQAALPPLQKQLAIQRDLIKSLAGVYPSDKLAAEFRLDAMTLPPQLPVSMPAELLKHRPDIRVADEMLRQASANIGVAIANRLPNITLSGADGSTAAKWHALFQTSTAFWNMVGNVSQTIFDAGALRYKEKAARDAFTAAEAQYRSTVIAAFQNVGDVLQSIQADQDAYTTSTTSVAATGKSLDIARKQYQLGDISKTALLPIEQSYLQARLNLAQSQANRLQDTAALFQALGGSWWVNQSNKNQ